MNTERSRWSVRCRPTAFGVVLAMTLVLTACGQSASSTVSSSPHRVDLAPGNMAAASESPRSTTPPRSKAVPAPTKGTKNEVVKARKPGVVKRADLRSTATLPSGVRIKTLSIKAMTTKAETPGEIAGPALAIKVRITNNSDAPLNVDSAIVTLTESQGAPAQPMTSDPFKPMAGQVAVGASTSGTYVFLIPKGKRQDLSLRVEYLAGKPIVEFVGDVS